MNIRRGLTALLFAALASCTSTKFISPDINNGFLRNRIRVEAEASERDASLEGSIRQTFGFGDHFAAKVEAEASKNLNNHNNEDNTYERIDGEIDAAAYWVLSPGKTLIAVGPTVDLSEKNYDGNTSYKHKRKLSAGLEVLLQKKGTQVLASVEGIIPGKDASSTSYSQDRKGEEKGIITQMKYLQKLGHNVYFVVEGKVQHRVEDIERFAKKYKQRHSTDIGLGTGFLFYLDKKKNWFVEPSFNWQWYRSNLSNHAAYQLRLGTTFGYRINEDLSLTFEPFAEYNPSFNGSFDQRWKRDNFNLGAEAGLTIKSPLYQLGRLLGIVKEKK